MRTLLRPTLLMLASLLCLTSPLPAQELKLLSEKEYKYLVGEISGDASYEHLRVYTQYHRPRGGAEGLMEAARYLMAFEVLNFIDGHRTGVEIYEAVSAEALQAGAYYYGRVTPEMMAEYIKNLSEAGLIRIK